jgi:hypothetical protein
MTQKTFERVRRIELELGVAPSHYEPGVAAGETTDAGSQPEAAGSAGTSAPGKGAAGEETTEEAKRREAVRL